MRFVGVRIQLVALKFRTRMCIRKMFVAVFPIFFLLMIHLRERNKECYANFKLTISKECMLKAFDTFIIIWIDMKSTFQMKMFE